MRLGDFVVAGAFGRVVTRRHYLRLFVQAYRHYVEHQGVRMAAALAYYALFAIVPLIIVVTYEVSVVVGPDMARGALNDQLALFMPERVATAIAGVRQGLLSVQASSVAPIVSAVLLVYAATAVLAEVRNALNVLWEAPRAERHAIRAVVKERALSLLVVVALAALLLASILVSAFVSIADARLDAVWEASDSILGESAIIVDHTAPYGLAAARQMLDLAQLAANVYGLSATLVLVLLLFLVLPDKRLPLGASFAGALLTTMTFWIGQWLLAFYFSNSARLSAFGTATTAVVVLIWAYYSAQILYFGAAFAYAFANGDATGPNDTEHVNPLVASP